MRWCRVQPWGHICSSIALWESFVQLHIHANTWSPARLVGCRKVKGSSSTVWALHLWGSAPSVPPEETFIFSSPGILPVSLQALKPSFPGFIQSGRHRVAMIPVARGINIASFHTDPLDITCVWPTFFKSSLVKAAASAVGMSVCQDCLFHVFSLGDCI